MEDAVTAGKDVDVVVWRREEKARKGGRRKAEGRRIAR